MNIAEKHMHFHSFLKIHVLFLIITRAYELFQEFICPGSLLIRKRDFFHPTLQWKMPKLFIQIRQNTCQM